MYYKVIEIKSSGFLVICPLDSSITKEVTSSYDTFSAHYEIVIFVNGRVDRKIGDRSRWVNGDIPGIHVCIFYNKSDLISAYPEVIM